MRYGVLGPLEVTGADGGPLDLGGAKPRALLALLLADAGRVVGVDRIVATLWGDDPPPTATGTLQAYVSHLRRVLEPDRGPREAPAVLLTRAPGYLVRVDWAPDGNLCVQVMTRDQQTLELRRIDPRTRASVTLPSDSRAAGTRDAATVAPGSPSGRSRSRLAVSTLASPQSMTWTSPNAPTMTLAGFRSRWTTPWAWA